MYFCNNIVIQTSTATDSATTPMTMTSASSITRVITVTILIGLAIVTTAVIIVALVMLWKKNEKRKYKEKTEPAYQHTMAEIGAGDDIPPQDDLYSTVNEGHSSDENGKYGQLAYASADNINNYNLNEIESNKTKKALQQLEL